MAKRKQLWHPDEVKQKIQVSQLINRLTVHALSDEPIMDNSQVNAACRLINKVLPDVAAVQVSGDPDRPLQVESKSLDEFLGRISRLAERRGESGGAR